MKVSSNFNRLRLTVQFYAAAPLRCTWKDTFIDIATLCIYDDAPRDTFDTREQSMLLNLANMLTYQLTSLVSQGILGALLTFAARSNCGEA